MNNVGTAGIRFSDHPGKAWSKFTEDEWSNNPEIVFQYLGKGSEVAMHTHESEQFGYCIKGGFVIIEDGKRYEIGADDAYIIPANVPHSFIAVGDTEAIDIFHPLRTTLPDGNPA